MEAKKTVLKDALPCFKEDFFFIGVSGSTGWDDYDLFDQVMSWLFLALGDIYMLDRQEIAVVSGGAKGTDSMAERWARELSLSMAVILPDWNRYGRAAGPIRNSKIVETADLLVAFPKPSSRGTLDAIQKAQRRGIPVLVLHLDSYGEPDGDWEERAEEFIEKLTGEQ